MRFVVSRVEVLPIPATWKIDLGPNAAGTAFGWNRVVASTNTVEVETQKGYGLLSETAGIVGPKGRITRNHPKVIGKGSGRPGLIAEQIIDDSPAIQRGKGTVCPLEIEYREPVVGFILRDWDRSTFTLPKLCSIGIETKITATKDAVNVARDSSRIDNGVYAFIGDEIFDSHKPICIGKAASGEEDKGPHDLTARRNVVRE